MSREGSIWLSLQGVQLGHRGGRGCEANQAGGSAKKRIADDRGRYIWVKDDLDMELISCVGRNRPSQEFTRGFGLEQDERGANHLN